MRLASIILPHTTNTGESTNDYHRAMQLTLIDTFGGFTASQVSGGWRDDATGQVYIDVSTRYDLAMDDTADNHEKLVSLARFYGHAMKQIAVMITLPCGSVEFVTVQKEFA